MPKKPTAAPVRQEDIAFQAKKKDATLLVRYAKENGAAALPFLEDALTRGNKVLRRAAIAAMRPLDAARAERQVQAMRAALAQQTTKAAAREREGLLPLLLALATPSSVKAFLAEGGAVNDLRHDLTLDTDAVNGALLAHFTRQAPGLDPAALLEQLSLSFPPDTTSEYWEPNAPAARKLAWALLDQEDRQVQEFGVKLLCSVDGARGIKALMARGHRPAVDLAIEACRYLDAAGEFEGLSGYLDRPEDRHRALAVLRHPDRRWLPLIEPYLDEPEASQILLGFGHLEALRRRRAEADRAVFDATTRRACYDLGHIGDPQVVPMLLRWLRDPVGREASPMLLTALGCCATVAVIPELERLTKLEPTRAAFYQSAITAIRLRPR
jgi:hypothetical protein